MDATGLSKGAIYHHFASKEDILLRIGERMGEENAAALQRVLDAPGLNGAQKLKEVFRTALQSERQAQMLRMIPYLVDNPRFLTIHVREIFELVAPAYIAPILEEGARDGSLRVERPRQMAEASWYSATCGSTRSCAPPRPRKCASAAKRLSPSPARWVWTCSTKRWWKPVWTTPDGARR